MIVIHAGLKKAGSAAIQTFLSANEGPLRELGAHYTTLGRGPRKAHHHFAGEVRGRGKHDARYGTLADVGAFWAQVSDGVLILSSEMLEECNANEAGKIRDALLHADSDFRVVLVLRNLVQLLPSSYIQKIKFGANAYDFDDFFHRRMLERRVHYFGTVSRWAEAFGWENVSVRLLDSGFLTNGDLIDDFVSLVGLDPQSPDVKKMARPGEVNVAPGWRIAEAVRALYAARHGLPDRHPLASANLHETGHKRLIARHAVTIGQNMGWNKDRGNYLTFDQARQCFEVYRSNVVALNERLSVALPQPSEIERSTYAARTFLPDASHIPAGELLAFYDELGAAHQKLVEDRASQGRRPRHGARPLDPSMPPPDAVVNLPLRLRASIKRATPAKAKIGLQRTMTEERAKLVTAEQMVMWRQQHHDEVGELNGDNRKRFNRKLREKLEEMNPQDLAATRLTLQKSWDALPQDKKAKYMERIDAKAKKTADKIATGGSSDEDDD